VLPKGAGAKEGLETANLGQLDRNSEVGKEFQPRRHLNKKMTKTYLKLDGRLVEKITMNLGGRSLGVSQKDMTGEKYYMGETESRTSRCVGIQGSKKRRKKNITKIGLWGEILKKGL